jgi:hypothetical protein
MSVSAIASFEDELFADPDSPMTEGFIVGPEEAPAPTFTIFDWTHDPAVAVPMTEWVRIFWHTAADVVSPRAVLTAAAPFTHPSNDHLVWRPYCRSGEYLLEVSKLARVDNGFGARLVNRSSGMVLQYQPETWTTSYSVVFEFAPISSGMPALTTELPAEFVDSDTGLQQVATRLEALCAEGNEEDAISLALDEFEERLRTDQFEQVDALLGYLDPSQLDPSVTVMVLTITWHGKEDLRRRSLYARDEFVRRAEAALRKKLTPERAEALLADRR